MPSTADIAISVGTYGEKITDRNPIYFGFFPVTIKIYDDSRLGTGGFDLGTFRITPGPTGTTSYTMSGFSPSNPGDIVDTITITGPGSYSFYYSIPFGDGGTHDSVTKTDYVVVSRGGSQTLNTSGSGRLNLGSTGVPLPNNGKFDIIR